VGLGALVGAVGSGVVVLKAVEKINRAIDEDYRVDASQEYSLVHHSSSIVYKSRMYEFTARELGACVTICGERIQGVFHRCHDCTVRRTPCLVPARDGKAEASEPEAHEITSLFRYTTLEIARPRTRRARKNRSSRRK